MKYAIIRTGGKQYKVAEGQVIEVEHLASDPNSSVTFDEVLLVAGENSPMVGAPIVANAVVSGKVLGDFKGEKIKVSKYKAKVRYRRTTGHRQLLTRVQIEKIEAKDEKKTTKKESSTTVQS